MKSTMIPVFIFVINWHFRQNVFYLVLLSRHGYFHQILILLVKMVELLQQHTNTSVNWSQILSLPILAKSSILNVAEFLGPSLQTLPCTKTSSVLCGNQSFFLLFWNVASVTFLQYDEVFLINLLDGCYDYQVFMDPVNRSKSKLLLKEYISLKSKIRFGYVCL